MLPPRPGDRFELDDDETESPDGPESIRDLQRRRRADARFRSDIQSLLATPMDDDEEEAPATGTAPPPPARVFVVFQGAKWDDPEGGLRESDTIVGVYASEDAARRAAAQLTKNSQDRADAWYQPYKVED